MKKHLSKEQIAQIMPTVIVIVLAMAAAAILYYFQSIWSAFAKIVKIITPFLVGFGISFLLAPVQNYIDRLLLKFFFRKNKKPRLMTAISSLLSLLLLIGLIAVFMSVVLPQLIRSVTSIISYVSVFIKDNEDYINSILLKVNFLNINGDSIAVAWDNIVSSQLGTLTSLLGNVLQISGSVVNVLYTILISFITAFYIMMDKAMIGTRLKKTAYSLFKENTVRTLVYWTRRANHIFTGFVSGKILDSLVIGVICYVCVLIFGMKYPLLISCIIGVTNVIPFFGPFIGWFPCALFLLIVKPIDALWFTVFILILQQIDGNVIGPHILGNSVGVSAFSIMVVIIVGSGLFGFVGMLLAVPVYALADAIIKTITEDRLVKKGLNTNVEAYVNAPETSPRIAESEQDASENEHEPTDAGKEDKA